MKDKKFRLSYKVEYEIGTLKCADVVREEHECGSEIAAIRHHMTYDKSFNVFNFVNNAIIIQVKNEKGEIKRFKAQLDINEVGATKQESQQ